MDRWIWVFIVVVVVILILALIGYLTGGWETQAWWCPSHSIGNCTGK